VFSSTLQVPICLAGTDTDEFLTAEPAIIIQEDLDEIEETAAMSAPGASQSLDDDEKSRPATPRLPFSERRRTQHGITLRRAVNKLSAIRRRAPSVDSEFLDTLNEDEICGVSPFERSMSSRNILENTPQGSFRNRRLSTGETMELRRTRRLSSSSTEELQHSLHDPLGEYQNSRDQVFKNSQSDIHFGVLEDVSEEGLSDGKSRV
jgi:hypothetical protein